MLESTRILLVLFVSKLVKLLRKGLLYDINEGIYDNWGIYGYRDKKQDR